MRSQISKQSPKKQPAKAKPDPEMVASLESITSLSRAECMGLLEAAQWKLEKAIELHFGASGSVAKAKTSTRSNGTSAKNSNKRSINDDGDDSSSSSSNSVQAITNGSGDDHVRAPIPQKSEKLLDYDPYGELDELVDGFYSPNKCVNLYSTFG